MGTTKSKPKPPTKNFSTENIICFKNQVGRPKKLPIWINKSKPSIIYITKTLKIIEKNLNSNKTEISFSLKDHLTHITKADINKKMTKILIDPISPILVAQMPKHLILIVVDLTKKTVEKLIIEQKINPQSDLAFHPVNIDFEQKIFLSLVHSGLKSRKFSQTILEFDLGSRKIQQNIFLENWPRLIYAFWARKIIFTFDVEFSEFCGELKMFSMKEKKLLRKFSIGVVQDNSMFLNFRISFFDPEMLIMTFDIIDFKYLKTVTIDILGNERFNNTLLNLKTREVNFKKKIFKDFQIFDIEEKNKNWNIENFLESDLDLYSVKNKICGMEVLNFRVYSESEAELQDLNNLCFLCTKAQFIMIKSIKEKEQGEKVEILTKKFF